MQLRIEPEHDEPKDHISGRDTSLTLRRGPGIPDANEASQSLSHHGPGSNAFVLYAEQNLALGTRNHIEGGDVGVRSGSRRNDGAQLIVGARSRNTPQYEIIAPSITLGDDVECGRILTDVLVDDGIPLRSEHPFPASTMPTLPLASVTSTGSQAVTVAQGQVLTLTPGQYGNLTVDGSLVLNPGKYTFPSISIGFHATVASAGPVTVMVANYLTAGRKARLHPLFDKPAGQLLVVVAGTDPDTTIPTVSFGKHTEVRALINAPHGTVTLADHVHITGAVAGFAILTGEEVRVRYEGGFPEQSPDQSGSQQLSGAYGVPPGPNTAPVVGPVPADKGISLSIGLPIRDNTGLQALIASVSNPKSSQFRQYISQTNFNATYGATVGDYQELQAWADAAGFTTIATFSNRLLLRVTGTAAQVQQALFVNLLYRERPDGSLFIATDRNLSLNLSVPVLEINGLGEAILPIQAGLHGTGAGGSYRAADLRNAYLGVGSPLQALDGSGQNVGIVDFESFVSQDVDGYFQTQLPSFGEEDPLPQPNVSLVETEKPPIFSPSPPSNSSEESTVDVEMVYAMAPSATISVFQGTTGITDRLDSILHGMATFSPSLTVASCSLGFGKSGNSQQAIDQMAAQGVSFFTASGDGGSNANPTDNLKMNNQTLVGGTILSTNSLGSGGTYPSPYYSSEVAWPSSGGGIMSDVTIPDYQVGIMQISAGTNGGSTTNRNYPDVAMLAQNAEVFTGGSLTNGLAGTSFAAPLWAGFTALMNQMSLQNNSGLMGFLNPTLYDIGLTRGESGNSDLYDTCFNDIQKNSNGGFNAVPGYDLVTGLGTPKGALIFQLTNLTPTVPVEFHQIRFIVGTGGDDLRNDSTATADVSLKNGEQFTVTLKAKNAGSWGNGTVNGPLDFDIPSTVTTLPTPTQALSGVQINLIQGGSFPETDDNWDITTLQVSLFNPGSPQFCQLDLVGEFQLQDGSTGLVRLSGSKGSSGNGPSSPIYSPGPNSGC
jgi:Pro-kumamolisin, activation domain